MLALFRAATLMLFRLARRLQARPNRESANLLRERRQHLWEFADQLLRCVDVAARQLDNELLGKRRPIATQVLEARSRNLFCRRLLVWAQQPFDKWRCVHYLR